MGEDDYLDTLYEDRYDDGGYLDDAGLYEDDYGMEDYEPSPYDGTYSEC